MSDRLEDRRTSLIWVHSSIDDMTNLSPNAMRVYMHLVRRANGQGVAWPGLQSIGDHCFTTVYKHADSRRKHAVAALAELIDAKLIRKEERMGDAGQKSNLYYLLNPVTVQSYPCDSTVPPPVTVESHPPVTVQSHEGIPIEGNTNEGNPLSSAPAAQTPQQEMFGAVCEAIGWDYNTLGKEDKGQVAQAVGILKKANYTVDDIRRFMVEVWFNDWRWKDKSQFPTLKQLRQEIGKLRSVVPAAAPKPVLTGAEGYRELLRERGIIG